MGRLTPDTWLHLADSNDVKLRRRKEEKKKKKIQNTFPELQIGVENQDRCQTFFFSFPLLPVRPNPARSLPLHKCSSRSSDNKSPARSSVRNERRAHSEITARALGGALIRPGHLLMPSKHLSEPQWVFFFFPSPRHVYVAGMVNVVVL